MAALISSLLANRARGATGTVCLCGTAGESQVKREGASDGGRGMFLSANVLEGKAVVLVMESCASEMAFSIRFLLACLAGGRVGLKQSRAELQYSPAGQKMKTRHAHFSHFKSQPWTVFDSQNPAEFLVKRLPHSLAFGLGGERHSAGEAPPSVFCVLLLLLLAVVTVLVAASIHSDH